MKQESTEFNVQGVTLRGFFHRPDIHVEGPCPIIVMGNGFATEWQFGTEKVIAAFVEAGYATLNFDYRGFGISDTLFKQPRQVVDTQAQLDDWRAAIKHAKNQDWVDNEKIIFWGSSLGGGHCITMASEFTDVVCAVAQVPHCCSRAAFKVVSTSAILTGMSRAIKDVIGALFGAKPVLLPVVSEPDTYGVMNYPGWKSHYYQIAAHSVTWDNAIPARSLLRAGDYRPVISAKQVICPMLIIAGKQDAGVPFTAVEETVANLNKGELYAYEGDHFDVYHGHKQAGLIAQELAFIQKHVSL